MEMRAAQWLPQGHLASAITEIQVWFPLSATCCPKVGVAGLLSLALMPEEVFYAYFFPWEDGLSSEDPAGVRRPALSPYMPCGGHNLES